MAIATGHHTLAAGPVVIVTPSDGMNDAAVDPHRHARACMPPEGGMSGTPVDEGGVRDDGGLLHRPLAAFGEVLPRLLRLLPTAADRSPTGYALYLIDVFGNKELIYRDPAISCFIPIPLRPRPRAADLPDVTDPARTTPSASLADVDARRATASTRDRPSYLRIAQRLPVALRQHARRAALRAGRRPVPNNWTPVRILGDVPVEPDGSAHFRCRPTRPSTSNCSTRTTWNCGGCGRSSASSRARRAAASGCHETAGEAPDRRPLPAGHAPRARRSRFRRPGARGRSASCATCSRSSTSTAWRATAG